jgi:adenosylcobinamide kinase/adenosylcobinamide-phosphate guanylyltransferase
MDMNIKNKMIYYITGGERSGKSRYAQQLALELTDRPIYIATSRIWDKDFSERVQRHKNERDERWTSVEEEKQLSKIDLEHKVAVIDCVTLWLTNYFVDTKNNVQESLKQAIAEFDKLSQVDTTVIIISNEIGMGVHADTEVGRKFVELQGWMNQYIAAKANKAILMVSGIPVTIKGN